MGDRISGTPLQRAKRIATAGLTFGIPAKHGVFPPRDVANAFFACGYDDAPDEQVLEWEPFGLTEVQYKSLLAWWRQIHGTTRVRRLGVTGADFSRWFTRVGDVCNRRRKAEGCDD